MLRGSATLFLALSAKVLKLPAIIEVMLMSTMLNRYRSAAAFTFPFVVASTLPDKADALEVGYIGAEKCAGCHKGEYDAR